MKKQNKFKKQGYKNGIFRSNKKKRKPKLAIQTNTSLKYKKRDGSLGDKTPKTALITAVRSAGEVAAMDKGQVTFKY